MNAHEFLNDVFYGRANSAFEFTQRDSSTEVYITNLDTYEGFYIECSPETTEVWSGDGWETPREREVEVYGVSLYSVEFEGEPIQLTEAEVADLREYLRNEFYEAANYYGTYDA